MGGFGGIYHRYRARSPLSWPIAMKEGASMYGSGNELELLLGRTPIDEVVPRLLCPEKEIGALDILYQW